MRYGVVCRAFCACRCAVAEFSPLLLFYSADDWKFAAEQFVRRMPDKVIVHREFHGPFL